MCCFEPSRRFLKGGPPVGSLSRTVMKSSATDSVSISVHRGTTPLPALYGPEAVTKAGETSFDVLVLDKGLPLLDGIEVYKRIKETQANLIAAIITGAAGEIDSKTLRDLRRQPGVVSMEKPFDEVRLVHLLQDLCSAERRGNNQ